MSASAAPSMEASSSSVPRSMRSWLRREETPLVSVSVVSVAPICSGRMREAWARSTVRASVAPKGRSSTGPAAAGAGPAGAASAAGAGACSAAVLCAGAWASAAGSSAAGTSKSGSVSSTAGSVSVASTRASSRRALCTVTWRPACWGRRSVLVARFARVGELARPTSTMCSIPRPPSLGEASRTSWVSIQRTGEANCQARSSTSRTRASSVGRFAQESQSARISSTGPEGTTSRIERAKSWVRAKGRATRLGT